MSKKPKNGLNYLVKMSSLAMLTALEVVLSRLVPVVSSQQIKISFAFVPLAIAAYLYGIKGAAAVAGVSDVIGAVIFPVGDFFPGFTLTAVLRGICFGIFLGRTFDGKLNLFWRSVFAVTISQVLLSLILDTYWISFMYHTAFVGVLVPRILQTVVMICVQVALTPLFIRAISKNRAVKLLRN